MADLKNIYATLDIGTNYIKGVVAEIHNGKMIILASAITESDGIVDNYIEDYDAVVSRLRIVVDELCNKVGVTITRIVLGIPTNSVAIAKLYGETYITSENRVIRSEDLQRAIVDASEKYQVADHEIVNVIPLRYNIDGYQSIIAIGSEADKLGVELLALTAPSQSIYPYLTVAEMAGLEIIDICLSPLAEQYEIIKDYGDEDSTICVNIGFSKSSITINYNGELKGIGTFGIGLKKIVVNLVEKFDIHPVDALEIITKYGFNVETVNAIEVEVKKVDGELVKMDLKEILSYANHLMMSLLITFKKEVEKYNIDLFDKVIISGGCCEIEGFESLCDKVFEHKSHIYKPNYIGARHTTFSTAFGLVRYIVEKSQVRGRKDSSIDYDSQMKLTTPKKKVLNLPEDSVIGKLFEYFL